MKKLWGGRFEGATDKLVEAFSESVSFDARLAPWDIRGSIAHARMLGAQGIIRPADAKKIVAVHEASLRLNIYHPQSPALAVEKDSSKVLKALMNIRKMKGNFHDGVHHYYYAFEAFKEIADRRPTGRDDLIATIHNGLAWNSKTILECELITLLKSKLRFGIANRIDLQCSALSKSN